MALLIGLQAGLETGLLTGLGASIHSVAAAGYSIDTLTPADIAAITGKAEPTFMWRGSDASGATELVSGGSGNCADAGTPVKQVDDTALGGLTTEIDSITDGLIAGDATTGNVSAGETITVMSVFRYVSNPTGNNAILGKISSPADGWELRTIAGGAVVWSTYDGATVARFNDIAPGLDPQTVLCTRSVTDNVAAIWTKDGTNTGDDGLGNALDATDAFTVGDSILRTPAFFRFGFCAIWTGSNGDGFGEADRLAVAQALGYE